MLEIHLFLVTSSEYHLVVLLDSKRLGEFFQICPSKAIAKSKLSSSTQLAMSRQVGSIGKGSLYSIRRTEVKEIGAKQ